MLFRSHFDYTKIPLFIFIDASNDLWTLRERSINRHNSTNFEIRDSLTTEFKVEAAYLWGNNELWLAGNESIAVFDTRTRRFTNTPHCITNNELFSQSNVQKIFSLNSNSLLFTTENNGLFIYNRGEQTLLHQYESGFPFVGTENKISAFFVDSQENIWFGTEDQGFFTHSSYRNRFNIDNLLNEYFRGKPVVAVTEDSNRNLWILTSRSELYIYNLDTKKIVDLNITDLLNKSVSKKNTKKAEVSTIFIDDEGVLWLGSKENNMVWKCMLNNNKLTVEIGRASCRERV